MGEQTLEQYTHDALQSGLDEVLVREWPANHDTGMHEHPFDSHVMVVRGEFWLTVDGQTRHLKQGDRFVVPRKVQHAEKYGPEGATFWAARKN